MWLLPSSSSIRWKHHQYFSHLGPWFASSWQFLFPPHHPSNQGYRCSSFITPTYKATASDLFTPIFPSSHTKVLPQQVSTHIPWGWICSSPYSTIHKVLSLLSILPQNPYKRGIQMHTSALRKICWCPELPWHYTRHFCNTAATQRLNILTYIWISLLRICDLITLIDSNST